MTSQNLLGRFREEKASEMINGGAFDDFSEYP